MAVTINHDMDQGSNFAFIILARDASGNPIDLSSGYTASCQMRRHYSTPTFYSLTTEITGGTGYILVSLGPTGTSAIKTGRYFYDLELASNNGNTVQRLVEGCVTVYPEVSR